MSRRQILILGLCAALSLGGYLLFSWRSHGIGFPLDDAWIHQTYGRNLAERSEWVFFPGEPSAGSTAPLWSGLLALGHLLGLGPYLWTFFLGWLSLWGLAAAGAYGFSWLVPARRHSAVWAGLLLTLEWHLVWAAAAGMETILFAFLATFILLWFLGLRGKTRIYANQWLFLGLLTGISAWLRPEGVSLLGPLTLGVLLTAKGWREKRLGIFTLALGFLSTFSPYLIFNRALSGAWWPNTFYAKQAEYALLRESPLLLRLGEQFRLPLIGVGLLLLPGFLMFLADSLRRKNWAALLAAGWVVGHLVLYAVRLPVVYQHGRYVIPSMPLYFLLGTAGMGLWLRPTAASLGRRLTSRVWLGSTVVAALAFWWVGGRAYARDVALIESEMVTTARWVAANLDEQDLIAAHDIGALGYFAQRPLLDLAGLVSPDVVPFIRDEARLEAYIDSQGADYLISFPGWYPHLAAQGAIIYQTEGTVSPALGGENMTVYCWKDP